MGINFLMQIFNMNLLFLSSIFQNRCLHLPHDDVSIKKWDAPSNKKIITWNVFNWWSLYNKVFSVPDMVPTFAGMEFRKKWASFDKLHAQELKSETKGRDGEYKWIFLCVSSSP